MPHALLSLLWLSVILMFAVVASGLHLLPFALSIKTHVILALTGVTIALFAHTMTMFYFIGTGKKIKEFIVDWDEEYKEKTRQRIVLMKRKIFPGMTMICLVLMVAFILGGAFDARLVSKDVHAYAAYFALIYHVHVSFKESLYLFKNIDLIEEINGEARRRADSTRTASA